MLYSANKVLNQLTNCVDAHDLHHGALLSSKVSKRQHNFSNISLSNFLETGRGNFFSVILLSCTVTVKGDLGGVLLDVCNVGPLFSQLSSWYKIDGPFWKVHILYTYVVLPK